MRHNDCIVEQVNAKAIEINKSEISRRLKIDRDFENELIDICKNELENVLDYRYAYAKVDLDLSVENICDFGFMKAKSKNLYKNLSGCKKAYIIAVTTGISTDRLLQKLNAVSMSKFFITDALSSAAVESLCDYVDEKLRADKKCKPRFSIGYGDLDLSLQKPFLERLDAFQNLGITLNDALLMTPVKSITAIMGIEND